MAALTVTASLAQTLPSSTTGASLRLSPETKANAEGTADSGSQFPALLAGLFTTSGAVEDDRHAMLSDGALRPGPGLDTAAGIGTPLGGKRLAWHEDAVPASGAVAPIAKRSPERKGTAGHVDSTEQSEATSALGVPTAQAPVPEQQVATPTISMLQLPPTLAPVTTGPNLPTPADPVELCGGDGEDTAQSPAQIATLELRTGEDVVAAEKTIPVELTYEAKAPATFAKLWGALITGRQNREATPSAMATPKEESVDDEPAGQGEAVGVASLQRAEPRFTEVRTTAGEVESGGQPVVPLHVTGSVIQQGAQPPKAVTLATRVTEMGQTPTLLGATERGVRQSGSRSSATAVNASPSTRAGDVPSDRQEQGQLRTVTAPESNPSSIDAKPDLGWTGGAAGVANTLRSPLGSVLPTPTPTPAPHALSEAAEVVDSADEIRVPVERPSASTETADSSDRRAARTQASEQSSRRSSASVVAQVLALSGQVPRTADSIPSARASKVAPATLTESPVPEPGTQVRALAATSPDRDELAFAIQMQAMPTREDSVPADSRGKLPVAEESGRNPILTAERDVPVLEPAAPSENRSSLSGEPEQATARAARERRPEEAISERAETPGGSAIAKMIPHATQDTQVKAGTAPERSDTIAAKPVRLQDAMERESKPEVPSTPALREMKFEVTGGEGRVEVRLSERGGEVKMTVRTPDANLASTLRENLPTLSTRLAEGGFKSEAWHPAVTSPNEWRHSAQSSAGGASQDANSQHREQNRDSQDGAGQRRPKIPEEPVTQKQKGKDFAWLMSSLR